MANRLRWPDEAPSGRTRGTLEFSMLWSIQQYGGTLAEPVFPRGWKPVEYYADTRTWDLAPEWFAPILRVWIPLSAPRAIVARALHRLADVIGGVD